MSHSFIATQLVHLNEIAPSPWKNGGGVTRELLTWPSQNPWMIRLSVADITTDGPFSPFEGIDRWFGVLTGNGINLNDSQVTLYDEPLHFDGALAPSCRLVNGATRDLNLMTRKDYVKSHLMKYQNHHQWSVPETDAELIMGVFSLSEGSVCINRQTPITTPPESLLWWQGSHRELQTVSTKFAGVYYAFVCLLKERDGESHHA